MLPPIDMATSPEPLKDLLEESFKLFRVKSPDPDLYTKLMVPSSLAVIVAVDSSPNK